MGIIYKAKKYFSSKSLIKLYNAFILPYYIYCVEIWGNALSTVIDPLIKLQKKIIRVITNSHYLAHTYDLFLANNILPFNTLVQYRIGLIMFKCNFELVPNSLKQMFVSNNSIHAHNTRHRNCIHTFRGNNEFAYRTFTFQSVYLWNIILANVSIDVSFLRFKHILKHFLVNTKLKLRYDK